MKKDADAKFTSSSLWTFFRPMMLLILYILLELLYICVAEECMHLATYVLSVHVVEQFP